MLLVTLAAKNVSKVTRNAKDKVTAVLDYGSMEP